MDVKAFETLLQMDIEEKALSDLCNPFLYDEKSLPKSMKIRPRITVFGTGILEFISPLTQLETLRHSAIFMQLWKTFSFKVNERRFKENQTAMMKIQDVLISIWPPSYKKWESNLKEIRDGTITFSSIDKELGDFKRSEDLKRELQIFADFVGDKGSEKWMNNRLTQIEQYHQLNRYSGGANIIINAKNMFGLTGDFSEVEVLQSAVSNCFIYNCLILFDLE